MANIYLTLKKFLDTCLRYPSAISTFQMWPWQFRSRSRITTSAVTPFEFVSQWCHLMAGITVYKSRTTHFCVSSHRFRDVNITKLLTSKRRSRSRNITLAIEPFDSKYGSSILIAILMCVACPTGYHLWRIRKSYAMPQVLLWEGRSESRDSKNSTWPFD